MTLRFISLAAYLLAGAASASSWTASVDQQGGLPTVSRGGTVAMMSNFEFRRKDGPWVVQPVRVKMLAPVDYAVTAKNRTLGLEIAARVSRPSEARLVWEFDLHAQRTMSAPIDGGILFKFDVTHFGSEMGEPELLPANRGWAWGAASGLRVHMRFDPPLASVSFEQGRKSQVRALFHHSGPQERQRHTATLHVAGGMVIVPSTLDRFGPEELAAWKTDMLDWRRSPVDLSFLNAPERPAGKRGFLAARHDRLAFDDGTPARFWGTNVYAAALFAPGREQVRQHARRLSELGFNLVRLHHHDSAWVNPNIFGPRESPDTRNLSSAMLEKIDWWIKCLKDEGIYVWLDLHVGRGLKPGDGIDGFEEISKGGPTGDLKGFNYVNQSIVQAMKQFNEAYVNRRNVHTNIRYKDEPAIVAMLVTNENDITNHFGTVLLPSKNLPKHGALYMQKAAAFARAHGLAADRTWRAWEYGPSKLFLNDLERQFNVEVIAHLRAHGVKVPIATTSSWGRNPLSSLPALTAGDLIDAHSYGGVGELEKNPVHAPSMVHWIAAAQVAGKPLSVTEWNVESFPAPDRHSAPLYVAASASHQGWDALMQFAYAQTPLDSAGHPSNWHAYNDPALLATLPAAALLYRKAHVREAEVVYAFAPTREQLFYQRISPINSAALRTATEKGKLVIVLPEIPELPWLAKNLIPAGAKVIADPNQPVIGVDAMEAISDTGELRRNWEQGIYWIDTPRTQSATGWIGGRGIRLADVELAITTRNASVAVQSVSESPIRSSRVILISLAARAVLESAGEMPFYAEPVEGRLAVRAPKGLRLYAGSSSDAARREYPAPYENGRYLINLHRGLGTYWLVLR